MTLAAAWCRFFVREIEGADGGRSFAAMQLRPRCSQRSVGEVTFGHKAKGMGITDE